MFFLFKKKLKFKKKEEENDSISLYCRNIFGGASVVRL